MCIAQDVRRREASKPLPSHHALPQLKKTLTAASGTRNHHPMMNREDSLDSVKTAATETSHTSSHDHHHEQDLKNAAMDRSGTLRTKKGDGASASLVSLIWEQHQLRGCCTTPSPTCYDLTTEPPTTPHPSRQVLVIEFDASTDSHLYLPLL